MKISIDQLRVIIAHNTDKELTDELVCKIVAEERSQSFADLGRSADLSATFLNGIPATTIEYIETVWLTNFDDLNELEQCIMCAIDGM